MNRWLRVILEALLFSLVVSVFVTLALVLLTLYHNH